jgi:hypothetical protein
MGEAFLIKKSKQVKNKIFAIISVTYPENTTCTCSKGNITLSDENTNGKVIFNVPEAGTWTVSCSNGTKTVSQNVNITYEGQIENITLSLVTEFYIFKAGSGLMNNAGLWVVNYLGSETVHQADLPGGMQGYFWMSTSSIETSDGLGSYGGTFLCTESSYNITPYSKLCVDMKVSSSSSTNKVGLTESKPASNLLASISWTASTNLNSTQRKIYTVDVSGINSNQYIIVYPYMVGSTVYNIWLE